MEREEMPQEKERVSSLGWVIFFAILSTAMTVIGTVFATKSYGYALYLGLPTMVGFTVGFIAPRKRGTSITKVIVYSFLISLGLSIALVLTGVEGGICLIMITAPLFMFILLGFLVGSVVRKLNLVKNNYILLSFFMINPACLYVDSRQTMADNTVTSRILIQASDRQVWQVLTSRVDYNQNPNLFFRLGVNYPRDMQLLRRNDSSFLSCDLRNGRTDLWVDRLIPERLMRFRLIEEVIPVKELTIYDSLDTPHSHAGYFALHYGAFSLQPAGSGRCWLTATSDFSYKLSPAVYWKWWSNYLVNKMHTHVLEVIKKEAEQNQQLHAAR